MKKKSVVKDVEEGPVECSKCGELTEEPSGMCETCKHVEELAAEDEFADGGNVRIRQRN